MTARAETLMPVSQETREHLRADRAELHSIASTIDLMHADLRTDLQHGLPIDPDVLRIVRDAGDLLLLAARRLNPDQEADR